MPVTNSGDYIPTVTEKSKNMSNTETLFSERRKVPDTEKA